MNIHNGFHKTTKALLGFNPPQSVTLFDKVIIHLINEVKGKTFDGDTTTFASLFRNIDYDYHPQKTLKFSDDRKCLSSYFLGPDASDVSIARPFLLK